jgi:glyoxylase-like metal-dependent hydrolase (beta-lactamase superfamily II)
VTHGHGDHCGSLDALKERVGDRVQVLIPELDARILAGEKVVGHGKPVRQPATAMDQAIVRAERAAR